MIHINYPNGKKPDAEWMQEAERLTEMLKAAPNKTERDKIIDDNAHVWRRIRDWLAKFSNNKCWFSEARNTCFYWHVEHFRPKKEAEEPDRDGYWWLAFDFRNYRLCGSVTNSKKGSYFPLHPSSPVAGPSDNFEDEVYLLIDPTCIADVNLISFIGGNVIPSCERDTWEWKRANYSIMRYKLNDHKPFVREREKVWNKCKNRVEQLAIKMKEEQDAARRGRPSPVRLAKIRILSRKIKRMTSPRTEFSATARAFLLRDNREWVRALIE